MADLSQHRRVFETELESLKIILLKLDSMADELPGKLMSTDVARNNEECVRIQQTYVVLKEIIPKYVSKIMNAAPPREERWSFWKGLKQ